MTHVLPVFADSRIDRERCFRDERSVSPRRGPIINQMSQLHFYYATNGPWIDHGESLEFESVRGMRVLKRRGHGPLECIIPRGAGQ